MKKAILNANVVTPYSVIKANVSFTDGVIDYVGEKEIAADQTYDAEGKYVLPGFIDMHCHGGMNLDFMDASPDEFKKIADFHLSHGTTSLFATTIAGDIKETERSLETFKKFKEKYPDSSLAGVHLEGPWLSPLQCGAQNTEYMIKPDSKYLEELKARYPFIMRVSAAPELEGGLEFGRKGRDLGIVMSAAHTDANFAEIVSAFDNGYTLLTHFYSGMKGVTRVNSFRVAGAVEAGYYLDGMDVEIIADGRHLPIELLKLIYKTKGADRISLITDAVRASGLPDGSRSIIGSLKNGLEIIVEDQVAKLPDRQSFAGSTATGDRLYRTMVGAIGKNFVELSKMSSLTPARVMGLSDRGSVEEGKRADLVIMDENLNVENIILKGEYYK